MSFLSIIVFLYLLHELPLNLLQDWSGAHFFYLWVICTSERSPAFSCILYSPFANLEIFFWKSVWFKWVSIVILAGDWIQLIFLLDFQWVFYRYIIFSSISSTTTTNTTSIIISTTTTTTVYHFYAGYLKFVSKTNNVSVVYSVAAVL